MTTYTYHGGEWRAQLTVLSRTTPIAYAVYGLGARNHKSTSFRSGRGFRVYFGTDPAAAWAAVLGLVPHAKPGAAAKWIEPENP